jgi:regulatory protein
MNKGDAPAPDAASLQEAALNYLARYAATEAGLRRVLKRRIDRWAQAQPDPDVTAASVSAARHAMDGVIQKLAQLGAVSDAGFAEARARSLVRSGRSRRAVQATLVAKGVDLNLARDAAGEDPATELAAALVLARKRRIGPFRAAEPTDGQLGRNKELGILARAGFARDAAEQALDMDHAEAEQRIHDLRAS